MGHIKLTRWKKAPLFRKISMGTWRNPNDASVYALLELDMSKAIPFMEAYGKEHGIRVTPTHLVGRTLVKVFEERPELNGMIRGSKIYLRDHVDLFYSVNVPGDPKDRVGTATLSGATVFGAEKMSLKEIVETLNQKALGVRDGTDKNFKATFRILKLVPWWGMRCFLSMISFFNYGLNWNMKWAGIPRDPFGSVIISSVGGFGIDMAFAPLMKHSRVPMLVVVGAIVDKPVVVKGQVEVRPVLSLGVTFDHRFVDGAQGAVMARTIKKCFADPETYL